MIPQQITPRQPMPVEEYGRSITQVPSELAMPQSTGPLPVVGSGGVVGPLSRGEIDTLTIAHFVLARGSLSLAVESLLRHANPAGRSGAQKLVLASDLEELRRRMEALNSIQWPNMQIAHPADEKKT